jgi:Right handed beta helix region
MSDRPPAPVPGEPVSPAPHRIPRAAGALTLVLALSACAGGSPSPPSAPANPAPPAAAPALPADCAKPATVTVHTSAELTGALGSAQPGAVIKLVDGSYPGHFTGTGQAGPTSPITLCGSRAAVLDGGDTSYTLYLNDTSYWQVAGFTVRGGQKGVMVDNGQHDTISRLEIEASRDEGLHLRKGSSDNTVSGNLIHGTGQDQPKFGEGIYVGSAKSNWARYSDGQPDRSDRNLIENNTVSKTTAESVDIKEGTTGGILRDNSFTGPFAPDSAADSWVNVKGNGWQIVGNVGHNSNGDGFSVHQILDGWGLHNVFQGNTAVVEGPGYGIHVTKNKDQNTVACDNTQQGAAKGLSNTTCTP